MMKVKKRAWLTGVLGVGGWLLELSRLSGGDMDFRLVATVTCEG